MTLSAWILLPGPGRPPRRHAIPLDRIENEARTRTMPQEDQDLAREFNTMTMMIEEGHSPHPMEIWELVCALREAEKFGWANRLAEYLPD